MLTSAKRSVVWAADLSFLPPWRKCDDTTRRVELRRGERYRVLPFGANSRAISAPYLRWAIRQRQRDLAQ
jgi:hypothetical protein